MSLELISMLIYILSGFTIALLSTMAGIGGGAFMVPYFYFMGLSINEAIGTSKFVIVFISFFGAMNYIKLRKAMVKQGIFVLIGMIPASYIGAYLVVILDQSVLRLIIFIFILFYSVRLIYGYLRKSFSQNKAGGERKYAGNAGLTCRRYKAVLIGLFSGLVAGLTGTGGGIINMPLFLSVMRMPIYNAVASSTFVIFPSSLASAIRHVLNGDINYFVGLPFVIGSIIGANIGPRIAIRLRSQYLRLVVGIVLLYAGATMFYTAIT